MKKEELINVIRRLLELNPQKVTVGVVGYALNTSNNYKILAIRQMLIDLGVINRDKTFNREKAIEVLNNLGGLELPGGRQT
ncbi:MAG: hypothetical protein QXL22_02625 [Candidatus Nezhaarchaeales archaeon]